MSDLLNNLNIPLNIPSRRLNPANIKKQIQEIEDEFNYYLQNAEEHPFYRSTWQQFWQARYQEIKQEGKSDPEKYDYTNDWKRYWMKYIRDFYDKKIKFYSEKIQKELSPPSPISISSDEKGSRRRLRSRYSSDSSDSVSSTDRSKTPPRKRREVRSRPTSLSSVSSESLPEKGDVTLLSVCRTLSVLDNELGNAMSSRITDIVAKIIQLEKLEANSSELIIQNGENLIFLETVKEKLKGLIATNLLDAKKIPVVKQCIQNIAQLVHQHSKTIQDIQLEEKSENTKLTEIITKALAHFGKTDVTEEELEVITEIYLDELEKNINRPLPANESNSKENVTASNTLSYQNLSDDELKTLISNFTRLNDEEQRGVLDFITEIEEKEPERVEKLQSLISQPSTVVINDDDDPEDYNLDEVLESIIN